MQLSYCDEIDRPLVLAADEISNAKLPAEVAMLERETHQVSRVVKGARITEPGSSNEPTSTRIEEYARIKAEYELASRSPKKRANALYNLGVMHLRGLGIPVNTARALEEFERAAGLGHPHAQDFLASCYLDGSRPCFTSCSHM